MKRIWFAVSFLIIAACACLFEQIYIADFCADLNAEADKAIACLESGDGEGFNRHIKKIDETWDRKNDLLFSVSSHVLLDELSFKIHSLIGKEDNIYDVKSIVKAIYENSRIKISNIL